MYFGVSPFMKTPLHAGHARQVCQHGFQCQGCHIPDEARRQPEAFCKFETVNMPYFQQDLKPNQDQLAIFMNFGESVAWNQY